MLEVGRCGLCVIGFDVTHEREQQGIRIHTRAGCAFSELRKSQWKSTMETGC